MKKLYTLVLASAVALTAAATTRQQATSVPSQFKATADMLALPVASFEQKAVDFKSMSEVAGEYVWKYYGLLNGNSGNQTGSVTIKVLDETTGKVQIDGLFSTGTGITGAVTGTVDLKAGTLTLDNKQDLGKDKAGDQNYFYIKSLDAEGALVDGAASVASISATISGTTFTFPEEYVFAVGDPAQENLGWWVLTALNTFEIYTEPDTGIDLSEWTEFTTATVIDGWVLPVITYQSGEYVDPAEFPLSVKVAKYNTDPNLLLIMNPYLSASGFPLSGGETGYIVLDVTDPEFVLVMPGIYSGFLNGTDQLLCLNVEGFYVAQGYSKATIQASLTSIKEWSTLTEVDGNSVITIPNCRFNYPSATDKLYTWNGRADYMKAKITFKGTVGVKDVISDSDENAPVEYFNLQGVRIDQPAAGSLVIRRKGAKATKVLVK